MKTGFLRWMRTPHGGRMCTGCFGRITLYELKRRREYYHMEDLVSEWKILCRACMEKEAWVNLSEAGLKDSVPKVFV